MSTNFQPGDRVAVYLDSTCIRPLYVGEVVAVSPHGRLSVRRKNGRVATVDRSVYDVQPVTGPEGGSLVPA